MLRVREARGECEVQQVLLDPLENEGHQVVEDSLVLMVHQVLKVRQVIGDLQDLKV